MGCKGNTFCRNGKTRGKKIFKKKRDARVQNRGLKTAFSAPEK